jgi:putative hydrolase of HD superfamily
MDPNPLLTQLIALADFAMKFSRVERITFHPDGTRPETDSDHTIMLQLLAVTAAVELNGADPDVCDMPLLDVKQVMTFSLVHDLVEAYAGDTPSYRMDEDTKKAKEEREAAALGKITQRFSDAGDWMVSAIHAYEEQELPAARFVRLMDKLMPKFTHVLNFGTTIRAQGDDLEGFRAALEDQMARLRDEYLEFEPVFRLLFEPLAERALAAFESPRGGEDHVTNTKRWVEEAAVELDRRLEVLSRVEPPLPGRVWCIAADGRLTQTYPITLEDS